MYRQAEVNFKGTVHEVTLYKSDDQSMAATDQFMKDAHCHCLSVIFRAKHNYSAPTERKDFCHEALFGGIMSKCDGRN